MAISKRPSNLAFIFLAVVLVTSLFFHYVEWEKYQQSRCLDDAWEVGWQLADIELDVELLALVVQGRDEKAVEMLDRYISTRIDALREVSEDPELTDDLRQIIQADVEAIERQLEEALDNDG